MEETRSNLSRRETRVIRADDYVVFWWANNNIQDFQVLVRYQMLSPYRHYHSTLGLEQRVVCKGVQHAARWTQWC